MKRSIRSAVVLAGGCLLIATAAVASSRLQQDPAEHGKKVAEQLRGNMKDPAAMEAGMVKWQETMKKGPAHEFLTAAFVGEWDVETKMWMDPAAEPMASKGTATVESMFDGRYIRERFKGEMMGQQFEGESTTGFDNNKKLFVTSWMDSMSTGMMMMKGSISEDGKTLTFVGEMDEPMTGEMGKAIQMVLTVESPDKHTGTMSEILYGKPIKVMELAYTRKGGGGAGANRAGGGR